MEKLVKLLNQYEREKEWLPEDFEDYVIWEVEWDNIIQWSVDPDARWYFNYYIISKDYEFIKWLVDNDKIDRDNILKNNWLFRYFFYDLEYVKVYQRLIMFLSVEDNPLDFLISILK